MMNLIPGRLSQTTPFLMFRTTPTIILKPSLERNQILIFFLLEKYRFHKSGSYLGWYASIYFDQAYYIFGGRGSTSSELTKIGRLDAVTKTWSLAGELNQGRYGHGVIFDQAQFWVIGGYKARNTESCIPNGETVTCTEVGEALNYWYSHYPELALVADDYGNDC